MSFLDTLETALRQDERLIADDGSVIKSKAYDLGVVGDEALLKILLGNSDTKTHFFKDVDGVLVFDSIKFGWTVTSKEFLPDSYTKYKNKIGLVDHSGRNIAQSKDVCLVWPYKDCVLEGGQTKEDQKRDEIFYNETLAPDEVNRLLYPKVFTSAKRYNKDGVTNITDINDDDNLIIKGNNLLVLSSLLKRYEGQIRLINIDPPYNTGSDSFGYNDRFNHSSWLTFMKNRLDIAYKLLHKEGFLCCQVNESESYYLKVLLDEIFGNDFYVATLFVKVRYAEKTLKQDMDFHKEIEQVLVYKKSRDATPVFNKIETGYDKYTFYINETGEYHSIMLGGKKVDVFPAGSYEIIEGEPDKNKFKEIWASGTILDGNSSGRFFRDYLTGRSEVDGLGTLYKVYGIGNDQYDYRYFTGPKRASATKGKYYQGVPVDQLNGTVLSEIPINSYYDLSGAFGNCRHEGGVELRSGKKPEIWYETILKHFSREQDIVMDFYLGSGTSCAVAHKMNRHYIGVEQMDYIEELAVKRMNAVIDGEQSGASVNNEWQGGGSFVYCELKQLNQQYIEKAMVATTDGELIGLFDEVKQSGFISQKVNPADIDVSTKDFRDLSFEDKQQLLIELVNKNMLYVNLCDMDDIEFGVTEEEKAFTNSFYGRG